MPVSSFRAGRAASILFCHSYATWMTRYGELDTYGLVRTKRWKNAESADRYNHTIASPEARKADLLPVRQPLAERVACQTGSAREKR